MNASKNGLFLSLYILQVETNKHLNWVLKTKIKLQCQFNGAQ